MDIERKLSIFIIVWCFGTLLCDFDEDLYFWVGSSFRSLALVFLLANMFLNWALRARSPTNRRSWIDSELDNEKRRASNRIWPTSSIGSTSIGCGRVSVGAGSCQRSMQVEMSSSTIPPRGLLSAGEHLSAAGPSISCSSDGRFRQTIADAKWERETVALSWKLSDEKTQFTHTLSPRRYSTANSRLRRKSGENPVVRGKMGPLLEVGGPTHPPQQLSNDSFNLSRLGSQLSGLTESEDETWQGGAADQADIPTWLLLNLEARGLLNQTAKSVIDRRNNEDRQEDEQVDEKPPRKRSSSLPLASSIIRKVSALFSRKTSDPKYDASDDQNLRQRPSREIRQSIPDLIAPSEELPSSTDFGSCSFNIDKRFLERQLRGASSDQIGDETKSIASQAPYQRCRCVGQFHTCMTPASSILWSDRCSLEGSMSSSDIRKPLDMLTAHTSIRLLATEQFSATEDNELFVSVLNTQDIPPDSLMYRIDTIDPKKLATAILLDDAADLLVVDVRGKDHSGGHIPRSIHMRTADVIRNAGVLMNKIQQYNVSTVVFTCMYSVLRARKCASALIDYGQKENKMPVKICVLAGGFHRWLNTYRKDPEMFAALVENFNEDFWTMRLDNSGLVHIMDAVWSDGGQNLLQRHLEELGRPPPMTEQQDTAHSLPLSDKKQASVAQLRNSISDLNQINSSSTR